MASRHVPPQREGSDSAVRGCQQVEEGAGFAAMAASPRVPAKEPRAPAGVRNQHAQRSPHGKGGPGRGRRAPERLLPFRLPGQSAEECQGPGPPPAGASLRPPQDWDPAVATREPRRSPSPGTPSSGGRGRGAGRPCLGPAPRAQLRFRFPAPGLLRLGSPRVSPGWGGRC